MKRGVLPLLGLAVAFLACAIPALALDYEGVPAKTGRASFRFGSQELTFNFVEGGFSLSGISMFLDGSASRFTKGKSKCTITLTKATPTEVEGTADCPLLHDNFGELGKPLTNVKFYATTK